MRTWTKFGAVVTAGLAVAAVRRYQSERLAPTAADDRTAESLREEQHVEGGESVVEEWGKESFPASDPPQSW